MRKEIYLHHLFVFWKMGSYIPTQKSVISVCINLHMLKHQSLSLFFCSVSYPSLHPSERNNLLMPWRIFDTLMRASGHLRMRIDLQRPFKISSLIFVILGSIFLRKITIQVETHPFNHCLLMKHRPLNSKRIFIDIK